MASHMGITEERYALLKQKAAELLNSSSNKHPFYLARALHVDIWFSELQGDTAGFIDKNTIYINSRLDMFSKKIVVSHELGHYVLHGDKTGRPSLMDADIDSPEEFEANLFAIEIMPQIFSRRYLGEFEYIGEFNRFIQSLLRYSERGE